MDWAGRLLAAHRQSLLEFLPSAIHEITIHARGFYGEPQAETGLMRSNEAVHRLSGHLGDLIASDEALTESRAAGIAEQLEVLSDASLARLLTHTPLANHTSP